MHVHIDVYAIAPDTARCFLPFWSAVDSERYDACLLSDHNMRCTFRTLVDRKHHITKFHRFRASPLWKRACMAQRDPNLKALVIMQHPPRVHERSNKLHHLGFMLAFSEVICQAGIHLSPCFVWGHDSGAFPFCLWLFFFPRLWAGQTCEPFAPWHGSGNGRLQWNLCLYKCTIL